MNALTCICSPMMTLVLLGCSGVETPTPQPSEDAGLIAGCQIPFLGDPTMAPEIELVSLEPGWSMLAPIVVGGSISLLQPPNAGRVIFVGARVRNMNPCAIRLVGQLEDPVSGRIRLDSRLVNFEPTNDGWGGSVPMEVSTLSNLAVCPNQWAMQDIFDKEYELTVTVTDRDGRNVTQSARVVPTCDEPGKEASCTCLCKQGYKLGEQCSSSPP